MCSDRTQDPSDFRTFCLSRTCRTTVPVLHWPKGGYGLAEEGTCLYKRRREQNVRSIWLGPCVLTRAAATLVCPRTRGWNSILVTFDLHLTKHRASMKAFWTKNRCFSAVVRTFWADRVVPVLTIFPSSAIVQVNDKKSFSLNSLGEVTDNFPLFSQIFLNFVPV